MRLSYARAAPSPSTALAPTSARAFVSLQAGAFAAGADEDAAADAAPSQWRAAALNAA
jgi:hypothetical protein